MLGLLQDVDFLGFTVDWEHRLGDNFPLYLQMSRDECLLHLSEHHGDCSPGAAWGERLLSLNDPFGNRLIFFERVT